MSIKDLLNGPNKKKVEQDIRNMAASEPGMADFLIKLNGNNNRHEKNVYFCQFCQCFHLTHKDKYPTWNQYRKHKKR